MCLGVCLFGRTNGLVNINWEKEGDRDRGVGKKTGIDFLLRYDRFMYLRWNQSLKEMSLSSMVVHRWHSPMFCCPWWSRSNEGASFHRSLVPPWHRHFEMMSKCLIWQSSSKLSLSFYLRHVQKDLITHRKRGSSVYGCRNSTTIWVGSSPLQSTHFVEMCAIEGSTRYILDRPVVILYTVLYYTMGTQNLHFSWFRCPKVFRNRRLIL